MICKRCGTEIDTTIREADGSVICPSCGTKYRQKTTPKPEPQAAIADRMENRQPVSAAKAVPSEPLPITTANNTNYAGSSNGNSGSVVIVALVLALFGIAVISSCFSGNSGSSSFGSTSGESYFSFSQFSIEGTWKNTGSYTYGQVQSGAIVRFNGSNCNVVSPSDTYAFYKDGSDYRLDCTTMLFSETLSFEVDIIDNDHICIYTGSSNCLELTRVG